MLKHMGINKLADFPGLADFFLLDCCFNPLLAGVAGGANRVNQLVVGLNFRRKDRKRKEEEEK